MAFIFEKVAGEQCMVLGVREALVYPFDVGGWTELRVGMFLSITSDTGLNVVPENTELLEYNTNLHAGFCGLKDTGTALPGQNGCTFIGMSHPASSTDQFSLVAFGLYFNSDFGVGSSYAELSYNQSSVRSLMGSNRQYLQVTPSSNPSGVTGTYQYASYNSFRFYKTTDSNGKTGIYMQNHRADHGGPYTVEGLRTGMAAGTSDYVTQVTGYLTTHLSSTGTNIDSPNALFIYLPMLRHRLRIHALVVEKYS